MRSKEQLSSFNLPIFLSFNELAWIAVFAMLLFWASAVPNKRKWDDAEKKLENANKMLVQLTKERDQAIAKRTQTTTELEDAIANLIQVTEERDDVKRQLAHLEKVAGQNAVEIAARIEALEEQ